MVNRSLPCTAEDTVAAWLDTEIGPIIARPDISVYTIQGKLGTNHTENLI